MSNTWIILVFLFSLALLLFGIIKGKIEGGAMMLIVSLITGVLLKMDASTLISTVASGFGNMMASLGIVVALGSVLGGILAESGATDQIALAMLKKFGSKHANAALNATGYLVSIPVFMGPAYIILNPICTNLAKHTKKSVMGYTTALVVGLMCTHCLVIPTPGPLAVAGSLSANIGLFILYSLIVSLPASLVGGMLYSNYLSKKYTPKGTPDVSDEEAISEIIKNSKESHPSAGTAIFLILLPILLILFATLAPYVTQASVVMNVCNFLSGSNGLGALLISDIVAWILCKKYISKTPAQVLTSSLNDVGEVNFLLGCSGSYGAVIAASGIGTVLSSFVVGTGLPLFLMAFVISTLLKAALGSSATALVTTASLMAPMMVSGSSPVLVGLAICLGGLSLCLPTDGAFWEVKQFNNLSMKETFVAHTGGNLIACIVGFAVVCVLYALRGVLPGLL